MEKKKLLIVAVSVGVVLLIIIGIPLMMIAPRQNYAAATSTNIDRDWGTTVEPYHNQILPPAIVEPPTPVSVQPEEEIIPLPEETPLVTTITVPIPQTAAVPDTPAPAPSPKPVTITKPAPAAPKPAAKPPVQTAKPAPAPQPAKPAPKPAVAKPAARPAASSANNNYWVQTGAFSTKSRAEVVKESLADKGIASIIDNRDIDGKTWYRVRVGPYISETEAQYWLALVKSIDGFADSQIRLSQATP